MKTTISLPAIIKSPWFAVVLAVLQFVLGIGPMPFSDMASFTSYLTAHVPQVGSSAVIAYALWYAVKAAKDLVDKGTITKAMTQGRLHIAELVAGVEDAGGPIQAQLVKSAAADAAFVTLYHASDADKELTESLNATHDLYRLKRVGRDAAVTPKTSGAV